jgi:endogenous inhibitor of DNA gyrase (YacG/DUF329 family)
MKQRAKVDPNFKSPLVPEPTGPKAVCAKCGRIFSTREIHGQLTKFCSKECYYQYLRDLSANNPLERQKNGRNKLHPDRIRMQKILGRLLNEDEMVYRIGDMPNDIRVMTRSDIGKLTNNKNNRFKLVEDGNYAAHVVDNEASKMRHICPCCGNEFIKKNPNQVFCSKSCASHVKVHKKKEDVVQLKQVAYYVNKK